MKELLDGIEKKTAGIAVIGLGYVGLPVAALFAECGFDVLGIELRSDRVEKINQGICPIEGEEPGLAELISQVVATRRFRATTSYERVEDRDLILIDVETPVDDRNIPRYEALRSVLDSLGPVLKKGSLVIVESTISPGTMNEMVIPLLERTSGMKADRDFFIGNCPERVMPGKLLKNLKSVSRVVGGNTPETADTMIRLYRHIVQAELDATDCVTAELVKTAENAYRDVQIAFANEVALICEAVGGDVWKVRELVNKSPMRQMHLPGAGVGGHCIPKDPWLLAFGVKDKNVPLYLIPASRAVNDSMPLHIADLLVDALEENGRKTSSSRVLVLGYAYLENSDDIRNSPSIRLVDRLRELGMEVAIHDPYVSDYKGDVAALAVNADAIIVMVAHHDYKKLNLSKISAVMKTPVLIDGRSVFERAEAEQAGFKYGGVGKGLKKKLENKYV
ncbi:MAG: nucleotide sugar dehydrogenase [Anaerolineales bacterium]|nr:nucleotide sugar dehydrogenase [Anaerolineales bacterium]